MEYPYQSLFLEMGLGGAIAAPELASFPFNPSGAFAIDLWMKLSDCNTTKNLISKAGVFSLQIKKDRLEFCAQGYQTVTAEESVLPGVWTHVAVSCYQGDMRIFLDGAVAKEQLVTGTGSTNTNPVQLGSEFFGSLRLLRFYPRTLSAQEVKANMYQCALTSDMSAFYDFTCSPPKELKSERILFLPSSCKMLCAMPAAQFKGSAYLDVSRSKAVNPAGKRCTPYTVQLWARLDSDVQTPKCTLFYNADSGGTKGMELSLVKSGNGYTAQVSHWELESLSHQLKSIRTVNAGVWCNIAVTWANERITLYLDGKQAGQSSEMKAPNEALSKKVTLIGVGASRSSPNGNNWFPGLISRADVWDRALTAAELVSCAAGEPNWNADGLTGSWNFLTEHVVNRVDSLSAARVNELRITENHIPAAVGQRESQRPILRDIAEPLSKKQLTACRERAKAGADATGTELRANTCRIEDTVYFVLHDSERSYTVCALPVAEFEEDPMLQWEIELILVLLGAVISLLFSMNITYNTQLGTFLRLEIANNPYILIQLSTIRDAAGAIAFILGFFKEIFSANKLWQLLTLCVQLSFWSLVSGITKLAARLLGGPASWVAWLALTGGAILYHLSKKPSELPEIAVTSILFSHRQPGSICSINIRKNEFTTWPRPEWQPSTETERVPAVYRIARFAVNTDPLQIAVTFASSDLTMHTVSIRGVASGPNATLMGNTNTIAVTFTHGASGAVYFTLASHTLNAGGIRRADFSWNWQSLQAGVWQPIKTTNHKLYTILDSVKEPWSSLPNQRNNPWTDCLDLVYSWVLGQTTPQAVASVLTAGFNASAKVLYQGNSAYSFGGKVDGVHLNIFELSQFMSDWSNAAPQTIRPNCEDCCAIVTIFGNLEGCDLWRGGLFGNYAMPAILLIGETVWRTPVNAKFEYHVLACEYIGAGAAGTLNPTQYTVYDPCFHYHDHAVPAANVILAQNVQLSQYAVLPAVPVVPAPAAGFYREDTLNNILTALGSCNLVSVERLTI